MGHLVAPPTPPLAPLAPLGLLLVVDGSDQRPLDTLFFEGHWFRLGS